MMPTMNFGCRRALTVAAVCASALAATACGSSTPPPKAEDAPKHDQAAGTGPVPVVQQELGSIDERAVEQTFAKLQNQLGKCQAQGLERTPYLSGDVKVFLRVDQKGKVRYGYFEETSLGDRETERCLLDVFARTDWPKPIGGEAEVRHGFGFDPGSERPPTPWSSDKVMSSLDDAKDVKHELDNCKAGTKGDFRVTAYVIHDDSPPPPVEKQNHKPGKHDKHSKPHDKHGGHGDKEAKEGRFQSIGVSTSNKESAEKVDCVIDALRSLRVPSPGSYAAKVTFSL